MAKNISIAALTGSSELLDGHDHPLGHARFAKLRRLHAQGYKCRMPPPALVPPMLARLVRALPEGPQWEYEFKLDGYRLQAIKDGQKVHLLSRRGNDFTRKFAKIATNVSKIKAGSLILDCEAVVVDEQGNG